jgi:hypothetical protein
MNQEQQNTVQREKLDVMQKLIENMQGNFWNTETTSEFLQRLEKDIHNLIMSDF